jgi:DNA-binding IscR family transcriptional regulator
MGRDASEINYGELERLSALETLKGLREPESVTLGDLVRFLDARGLWQQFAKITLGDLRDGFAPPVAESEPATKRRKKPRILEEELEDAYSEKAAAATREKAEPDDGGMTTDEVARQLLPFIEGNGEVTLDDLAEYSRIDRKVLRHHLAALVKDGRLERVGVGRHAIYSAL